ncbi:MAG: hypothetical protein J5505_00935, partial [Spirochaetaceae bacterium]|nr:hypothetical protein [Spirochaetaceae bacterium]
QKIGDLSSTMKDALRTCPFKIKRLKNLAFRPIINLSDKQIPSHPLFVRLPDGHGRCVTGLFFSQQPNLRKSSFGEKRRFLFTQKPADLFLQQSIYEYSQIGEKRRFLFTQKPAACFLQQFNLRIKFNRRKVSLFASQKPTANVQSSIIM